MPMQRRHHTLSKGVLECKARAGISDLPEAVRKARFLPSPFNSGYCKPAADRGRSERTASGAQIVRLSYC